MALRQKNPVEPIQQSTGRRRVASQPPKLPWWYDSPWLNEGTDIPHPDITDRTSEGMGTREITLTTPKGKVSMGYGRQRLAGKVQYFFKSGRDLFLVKELCLGECDSLVAIDAGAGEITPPFTFNANFQFWFYPGTPAGQVDSNLAAVDATWNEAFPGVCYVVEKYSNVGTYWTELLNTVYYIKGRKCLDSSNPTGPRIYSENAWDQLFDFVQWSEGKALPASRVNAASFAAAKAADIAATRSMDCHMLLMEPQDPDDVINTFRLLASAYWFWDANQFLVVADRAGSPVVTYTTRHLADQQAPRLSRDDIVDRPNRVIGYFTDVTNKWLRTKVPGAAVETAPVAAGLEEPIEVEYELPWIHDAAVARSRLVYILNSHQFDGKLSVPWMAATADRQLGDIVTQNVPARGLVFTGRLLRRMKNMANMFEVVLHEYNAAKYNYDPVSNPAKTPSTLPDPLASPTPPTILTVTEQVDEPEPGRFVPNLVVTLSPAAGELYSQSEITYQVTGSSEVSMGPFNGAGPFKIPILEGAGKEVTVRAYAINRWTSQRGTTPSIAVRTMYDPNAPEPPDIVTVAAGAFDPATWLRPPVRTKHTVASGSWSSLGTSLFDATKIQDNVTGVAAAAFNNTNAGSTITVDLGSAIAVREIVLRLSGISSGVILPTPVAPAGPIALTVEYSDASGGPWTVAATRTSSGWDAFNGYGANKFWYSPGDPFALYAIDASAGAHRWWRILKTDTVAKSATINEIELYSYTGATYPYVRGWRIRGVTEGAPDKLQNLYQVNPTVLHTKDVFFTPTAAQPLGRLDDFASSYKFNGPADPLTGFITAGQGGFLEFEVATISPTNIVSECRAFRQQNLVVSSSNTAGPADGLAQPYLTYGRIDVPGANAGLTSVEVGPTYLNNIVRITPGAATGAFNVHGMRNGQEGGIRFIRNDSGFNVTLKNESATEATAANRFSVGADVVLPNGATIPLYYETATNRWRISNLDWAQILNKPATFPPSAHSHAEADVTNLVSDLAAKAPLASPVFSGDPTAPTPSTGDNDTSIATTAFVKNQAYAPLASPAFSGNPTTPTPAVGDNDTSIASTAFVQGEIEQFKAVSSDQTTTGTTFADITGLTFAVDANATYEFEMEIFWRSASTSEGVMLAVNGPSGATLSYLGSIQYVEAPTLYNPDYGTFTYQATVRDAYDSTIISFNAPSANLDLYATLKGVFRNGSTPGTFAARWRGNSGSNTKTIRPGSNLRFRKLY